MTGLVFVLVATLVMEVTDGDDLREVAAEVP